MDFATSRDLLENTARLLEAEMDEVFKMAFSKGIGGNWMMTLFRAKRAQEVFEDRGFLHQTVVDFCLDILLGYEPADLLVPVDMER